MNILLTDEHECVKIKVNLNKEETMMKKSTKKAISCLMAVMLVMVSVMIAPIEVSAETPPSIIADGKCGENLTWTLDDNGTLTVSGTGDMWNYDYAIPEWSSDIKKKPGENYRDKITAIYINDGVTSIGGSAFSECSVLTSVTIPDSVTMIGAIAFSGCKALENITIPDSVMRIGSYAFNNTAYYNNDENWENGVLYLGNRLIKAKDSIAGAYSIRPGTISVEDSAFNYCKSLKSITIPDGVTRIGYDAFSGCRALESVTIPDSVTSIEEMAFHGCYALESVTIPDGVTSIGHWAFGYCRALRSIAIPNSVTSIGNMAFEGCNALTSITIPDGVTYIGDGMFRECRSLTSITIPDNVTYIGNYAFGSCDALTGITIPDGVTYIGDGAFYECHKLTIYGTNGLCAQKYAQGNDIPFMPGVFVGNRYFLDVKSGAWYLGAIEYALDNGLFYGVSPKMFAPDEPMTRAMLVTVLWRMEGEPAVSGENPFIDVPSGEWYTDAVKWAAENDIVKGIEKDKYDPMADITREQAAAILYRYSQYKEYDVSKTADLSAFPDGNETSDYAVTELSWAYAEGLIAGAKKGDTDYLEPQGNATRAQVASILMRYKKNLAK